MNILVARISSAHGVRGQVKIRSYTHDPKAFTSYGPLGTDAGDVVVILKSSPAGDEFICTLKDVTDRNQAEALRGQSLFALRENLPAELLLSDLVGKAVTHNACHVGIITGFQNFGAGELMELDNGLLIPVRFMINSDGPAAVAVDLPLGFLDKE
jgi:16S rRNA processing protein RimM